MTAKDLMVDFANFIFIIIVSLLFFFYFVLGDRIEMLINLLRSMAPLVVFGIALIFKLKKFAKSMKKFEENEAISDDEIWYITSRDVLKDSLIICFLPLVILALAFMDGEVDRVDIIQSVFCFGYFIFFHWLMFRKDLKSELCVLNKNNRTVDDVVIYFFPIALLAIAMSENSFDRVDIVQAVSVFIIMLIRHHSLFKKEQP